VSPLNKILWRDLAPARAGAGGTLVVACSVPMAGENVQRLSLQLRGGYYNDYRFADVFATSARAG
jgi:hypothetical protein